MGTRLTDRDLEIFSHISTYRLTTREVLHQEWFSDSNINAVTKVCSKLVTNGYLNKYLLYGEGESRAYYVLGIRAIRHFGLPTSRGGSHGTQSLVSNFAFLGFCHFGQVRRRRLMVREIRAINPELLPKGLDTNRYYLQAGDERKTLGFLLVDHCARPDHLMTKVIKAIKDREKIPDFATLIDHGQFALGVATSTEARADAIRDRIARHEWPVPITVEVVPDLLHVIERNQ